MCKTSKLRRAFAPFVLLLSLVLTVQCTPKAQPAGENQVQERTTTADTVAFPIDTISVEEKEVVAVVYFGPDSITRMCARMLRSSLYCPSARIRPAVDYTGEDMNLDDRNSRASREQADRKARPALGKELPDLTVCKLIYLGYPIWDGKAPRIIQTVLESQDLEGIQILPFCTGDESQVKGSVEALRKAYPKLRIEDGIYLGNLSMDGLYGGIDREAVPEEDE